MKAIKLTEEHESKLLEMCNALFPEYKDVKVKTFNNGKKMTDTDTTRIRGLCVELPYIDMGNIDPFINYHCIHWFEFCVVHLVSAVQNAMPKELVWREQPAYVGNVYRWEKGDKWTLWTEFHFHYPKALWCGGYPRNPIDFLYSEFKKIK